MAKVKWKRQFRLYDIYRYYSTREMSPIEGIEWYEVKNYCSTVSVRYTDSSFTRHYVAHNESELKDIVRTINKKLGNCLKPGPMRRRR